MRHWLRATNIYKRNSPSALRIFKHDNRWQMEVGQLINLIYSDVNCFDMAFVRLHILWIMPFEIVFTIYLAWQQVGFSTLAGVLPALVLLLPIQTILGKLTNQMRIKMAELTGSRVKLINEVMSGIQVIKMYAWEKPFINMINSARIKEVKALKNILYLKGFVASSYLWTERLISFLTIGTFVYFHCNISAEQLFFVVLLYDFLSSSVSIWYPAALNYLSEALVSINRVRDFLLLEEKRMAETFEVTCKQRVLVKNVNASWAHGGKFALKDISFCIPKGALCVIVGAVGAGKTSIFQLLLGELSQTSGSIEMGDSISYASQTPWVFASTIRNNILLGHTYNKTKFKSVIDMCHLGKDLQEFPEGDQTLVGECGVILSGGQSARINLARALYRQADIYLLDDPLSAVDIHVGKHIFKECVLKYLKNKTRIIVTHQLQYLKDADLVIVINDGRIEAQGTFEELKSSNLNYIELLTTISGDCGEIESVSSMVTFSNDLESHELPISPHEDDGKAINMYLSFKTYLKAVGSSWALFGFFILLILSEMCYSGTSFWTTVWSRRTHEEMSLVFGTGRGSNSTTSNEDQRNLEISERHEWIFVYAGVTLITIALILVRSMIFFNFAMKASFNIHELILTGIIQAPISFFNMNPNGLIISRLSKDIGIVDDLLPCTLYFSIQLILNCVGNLVMILISNYYMMSFMAILGIFFAIVSSWYVFVVTKLNLLEGETHTPLFSYIKWSLHGITTIRAFKKENVLREEFENHQDTHTSASLLALEGSLFFSMLLKLLGVFLVSTVSFSCVLLKIYTNFDSSDIGLAISQSMIFIDVLQLGATQFGEVISYLISVDRVKQYTRLDNENELKFQGVFRSNHWPNYGCIEFKNVSLKFSTKQREVLSCLNFVIQAGSKIGVVGRTGAGKSSLISVLLRLVEFDGSVLIDNINTKSVHLNELRKNISVIPQEPVLFSSTLRYNLDPFQEFSDDKLWKALEEVEMKKIVNSLDTVIFANGKNFSVGQRQLLCLARAMLRNNKILILDEATGNVDFRTDSLIQATIRQKLIQCTVLTIAHRLSTIMDSDMVLVLDSGKIVEFDHPHILLQNSNGYFSSVVAETGCDMSSKLRRISSEAFERK